MVLYVNQKEMVLYIKKRFTNFREKRNEERKDPEIEQRV